MPDAGGGAQEPAPVPPGPPPTITALTGVRAVAAGWVLFGHFVLVLPELLPATRVLQPWSRTGALGVDVFFVLSGFVLSYNYAERLVWFDRDRYGAFLGARFARIYPVHLFTLLGSAALVVVLAVRGAAPSPDPYTATQLAGNLLLAQALPGFAAWSAPAWSISCEVAAYLVFPFVAARLLRLRRRTALGLAVLVAGAQLAVTAMIGTSPSSLPPMSWVRIAGEFTLGCLLWAAWRHGARPHRRGRGRGRRRPRSSGSGSPRSGRSPTSRCRCSRRSSSRSPARPDRCAPCSPRAPCSGAGASRTPCISPITSSCSS